VWWSVKETGVPEKTTDMSQVTDKLIHNYQYKIQYIKCVGLVTGHHLIKM